MNYTRQATGRFHVEGWEEAPYAEIDPGPAGARTPRAGLARAEVRYRWTGDIEGTSVLTYLLAYRPDDDDLVTGLEHFTGSVDGHDGGFVLQHTGTHGDGRVEAALTVVPGLGTGAFEHLRGEATLLIEGHSEDGYELTLAYDLG